MSNDEILVLPWKGESGIHIETTPDSYIVCEWRKGKEDREPKKVTHEIPKETVRVLYGLITHACEPGEKYGYRFLVRKVIQFYDIAEQEGVPEEVMIEMFNGGKMRAKHYFPKFYYPLKCLESLGSVQYWGGGGITLLETKPSGL